ncbi:MAG: hypothetical protein NTV79_10935 [Candidatus Aureabacteria bacterium]|nr:hypothetical protein [Candidatus Auribacterota bacterium]
MNLSRNIWKWPLFILAAAGYLWAKSYAVHYTASGDENAYFYMAKLMDGGKVFYRDFFFAHPPLELALLAAVYALAGFNLLLLKLTAILPPLIAAGFLYHWFWKQRSRAAGVLFLVLFLFNYEFLKISSHPFGLSLTGAFLMLSLYCFLEGKPFAAGIFWGLGALTGLYALPWGAPACVYYLLRPARGRALGAFLGGFCLLVLPVNAVFLLIFRDKYFVPVFLYHFWKPPGQEIIADVIIRVIRRNLLLFFLPFLYIWIPKDGRGWAILGAGLLYLAFLFSLNPLFTQYFMLPLPFLTWIGAASLDGLVRRVPRSAGRVILAAAIPVALALVTADNLRRYLVHERGTDFRNLKASLDLIEKNSRPDEFIFGQVTCAPLLALLSGRAIALDMVDTNPMRFLSGVTKIEEMLSALAAEPRLAVLVLQEDRLWLDPRVKEFLERRCALAGVFEEANERIFIFTCSNTPRK